MREILSSYQGQSKNRLNKNHAGNFTPKNQPSFASKPNILITPFKNNSPFPTMSAYHRKLNFFLNRNYFSRLMQQRFFHGGNRKSGISTPLFLLFSQFSSAFYHGGSLKSSISTPLFLLFSLMQQRVLSWWKPQKRHIHTPFFLFSPICIKKSAEQLLGANLLLCNLVYLH